MSLATITSKGQTTIPKEIRDSLNLQPKDQVQFTLVADETVIMRVKKRSVRELFGVLHTPERTPIAVDDMRCR